MAMEKSTTRTWSWWLGLLTLLAGLWLLISPWVLGFNMTNPAFLNAVIVGILIALCGALDAFGLGHMSMQAVRVFGVIAALLGLWAIVSPFILKFGGVAEWDAVLTGLFTL